MSNLIALSQTIVSLDHVLIDPSSGGAIAIVHDNREAIAAGDCDYVRWRATTRKVRRLHTVPRNNPLLRNPLHWGPLCRTPETSKVRGIDDEGPCGDAIGTERSNSHGHRHFS